MLKKLLKNDIFFIFVIFIYSVIFATILSFITPHMICKFIDEDGKYLLDIAKNIYNNSYFKFSDNTIFSPFICIINLLIYKFNQYNFVLILSIITIFMTNLFIFKTIKISNNNTISFISLIIINGLFISLLENNMGGITNNLPEFFAMPIISFLFYEINKNEKLDLKHNILISFFLCLLFILKNNFLGFIILYCIIFRLKIDFKNICIFFVITFIIIKCLFCIIGYNQNLINLFFYFDAFKLFDINKDVVLSIFTNFYLLYFVISTLVVKKINYNKIKMLLFLILNILYIILFNNHLKLYNFWILVPIVSFVFTDISDNVGIKELYQMMIILLCIISFYNHINSVKRMIMYKKEINNIYNMEDTIN